jgi:hypothetical protein
MNGVKKTKTLAAALILLFLMNSCAEFFSGSWGELFKRDPKKVKVDSSNVYDLLDAAKGDPDLSKEILNQIDANSNDSLKHAAIKAANQASGVTTLMLENIAIIIDATKSSSYEEAITEVANTIQNAMKDNDVVGISEKLTEILKDKIVNPSENPIEALINAGKVTVPAVPTTGGNGGTARVEIALGKDRTGTVTIIDENGFRSEYFCTVSGDGHSLLIDNDNEILVSIEGNDNNTTLTLSGLDRIPNAGLAATAVSDPVKIEFDKEFLDASVPDSDLTLMIVALILAKAEKERARYETLEKYLTTWKDKNVITGTNLDDDEKLIAATVNGMISRGELTDDVSELTQMLIDLLRANEYL